MAENDFFLRQRSVPDWYQPLIEKQKALVLGVGGIGCTVAKELCRLGVGEVVILDNDTVATSNVNRQVLFGKEDIGQSKVQTALHRLQFHNIHSRVSGHDCDAVTSWEIVVQLAGNSTVVFNCIDYGEYFDYAVTSLCVALDLPYLSASSYGHTAIAECYPSHPIPCQGPCWGCNNPPADTVILNRITPDKVLKLSNLDFLPQDRHMPSTQDVGSSILTCTIAATLTTGAWLNSIHGYSIPCWMSCCLGDFSMFSYPVEAQPDCLICLNAPKHSQLVRDLFFGSETVCLDAVGGQAIPYEKGSISNPCDKTSVEASQSRAQPCVSLGEDYANCYLPAIPAADLSLNMTSVGGSLPDVLSVPLVKAEKGGVVGLRSGGRSCILISGKSCYRLKGCGNYVDVEGMRHPPPGFPIQNMQCPDGGQEVRGCCFRHTALTEQLMSEEVKSCLAPYGIPVGNTSLGMWKYHIEGEPLPCITKFCSLFETLGEKRLASHLLPGLEALLPHLFPQLTLNKVVDLFPVERVVKDGTAAVLPTWKACCAQRATPIDLCTHPLLEVAVGPLESELSLLLLQSWCHASYNLRNILPLSTEESISCGSLMALLFWRLGWEVGVVKYVLEANDINWGYFFDHNPFEPHCNAHPNNFVILPPGHHDSFLAPVDFDLSFSRKGFFSPYTKSHDSELFDSWLASEHVELERALAGEMANSGITMAAPPSVSLGPAHVALMWGLRDTMVLGYRAAYHGKAAMSANTHPIQPRLKPALNSLVTLALTLTRQCSA